MNKKNRKSNMASPSSAALRFVNRCSLINLPHLCDFYLLGTLSNDQFIDEKIGKSGTDKRELFDNAYEIFKIGVLIQQARKQRGLTQEGSWV